MIRSRTPRSAAGLVAIGLLVLTAALGLVGCASGGDSSGGPTSPSANPSPSDASAAGKALPPVIVELDAVNGTTVEVAVGNAIDLTGDDKTFTTWSAHITDPTIVSFTPGKDDGSAQFNPGFQALAVGSTAVTLDNTASGAHVAFTIEVAPKK